MGPNNEDGVEDAPSEEVIDPTGGQPTRRTSDRVLQRVADNVAEMTSTAGVLIDEVRRSNDQVESDRQLQSDIRTVLEDNRSVMRSTERLLKAVWVKVVLLLIIMVVVLLSLNESRNNSRASRVTASAIADCTTPDGVCFKYNQARTAGVVLDIEVKRNVTELRLAELRGDTLASDFRRSKIAELNADLATLNQYAEDIRQGKLPEPPTLKSQVGADALAVVVPPPTTTEP